MYHLLQDRRVRAVSEMVRVVRPGGKALISVWALEQEHKKQPSNYLKKSEIRNKQTTVTDPQEVSCSECLSGTVESGDPEICTFQQEDKSLAVHVNRTQFNTQDLLVPWHKKNKVNRCLKKETGKSDSASAGATVTSDEPVYHRFYHVFKEGELKELIEHVPNTCVIDVYYDKGNWCVIFEKNQ